MFLTFSVPRLHVGCGQRTRFLAAQGLPGAEQGCSPRGPIHASDVTEGWRAALLTPSPRPWNALLLVTGSLCCSRRCLRAGSAEGISVPPLRGGHAAALALLWLRLPAELSRCKRWTV